MRRTSLCFLSCSIRLGTFALAFVVLVAFGTVEGGTDVTAPGLDPSPVQRDDFESIGAERQHGRKTNLEPVEPPFVNINSGFQEEPSKPEIEITPVTETADRLHVEILPELPTSDAEQSQSHVRDDERGDAHSDGERIEEGSVPEHTTPTEQAAVHDAFDEILHNEGEHAARDLDPVNHEIDNDVASTENIMAADAQESSAGAQPSRSATSDTDTESQSGDPHPPTVADRPVADTVMPTEANHTIGKLDIDMSSSQWKATDDTSSGVSASRRLDHVAREDIVTEWPMIATWAGEPAHAGSEDNELNRPYGLGMDADGHLYVSDTWNHRIQKIENPHYYRATPPAAVTVAGGNGMGRGFDQLRYPKGIAFDGSGNLFIADSDNHRVMKWMPGAVVGEVVAGSAGPIYNKQGQQIAAEAECCRAGSAETQLREPHGVYIDTAGFIYVVDTGNHRVQLWENGVGSTVAGGDITFMNRPQSVFAKGGYMYVSDSGNDRVLAWVQGASVGVQGTVVVGGQGRGDAIDQLIYPTSIWIDDSQILSGLRVNVMYVCDTYNNRIMKYTVNGATTSDEGLAAGECLQSPPYVQPCPKGGLHYPPDPGDHRVDHINPSYNNPPVYHFWGPTGVVVGPAGANLTVADTLNHRVLTWINYR